MKLDRIELGILLLLIAAVAVGLWEARRKWSPKDLAGLTLWLRVEDTPNGPFIIATQPEHGKLVDRAVDVSDSSGRPRIRMGGGEIDEFVFFERVLLDQEIATLSKYLEDQEREHPEWRAVK